ncbi:MAG TPA: type II secretion system F family protein [Streptosporangiaceae bacterium]|jgi:Flp pilus assembly protein TadB
MIVLAALGGAAIACGLVLLVAELLRRQPPPGTPPRKRLGSGAGLSGSGRRILIGVLAGLAVLAVTRWPVAAIAVAVGIVFLPRLTFSGGQRKRTAMLEGLEQWIRRVADMLTASRGLEEAIETSARNAPAAIAGPVQALARRLSARTGAEAALRQFATDVDDPAGDRIAAALIIATGRRGGAVRDVLNALAGLLSRDVAARREIEAERAQHRTTVRWITVFVAGFTVFAMLNRGYSAPYGTFAGEVVLALVAGLYAGGLSWLHHLGSIPAPGRFLNHQGRRGGEDAAADQPAFGGLR